MTKKAIKVSLDFEIEAVLDATARRYGLTSNLILSAAAYELSRVRPENLFHALGRIADTDQANLLPGPAPMIAEGKKAARRPLEIS